MKTPEKIYCGNNGHGNLSYSNQPISNAIEYCRTDAFIDKACEWLNQFCSETCNLSSSYTCRVIEDFKKAMKL